MAAPARDTVYIDIDDEITGIIDKLNASSAQVVALVLPKRATVFQSIVNMKLLKRAAGDAKKNVVLITSEAGLLPLAGAAGIHVAKTLNSKPEIPTAPKPDDGSEETVQETDAEPEEVTAATAGSQAIGRLAGIPSVPASDGVETVELDDDEAPEDADEPAAAEKPKDKKLAVPNFDRFRLWLVLGGLLIILLIIGLILALNVLPKAAINIQTDSTGINVSQNFTADPTAKVFDPSSNTLPAKLAQQQKTYTQTANASGQKNEGNKASGNISITNCGPSAETFPAGTGFSAQGLTFISQSSVTVPTSTYTFFGNCKDDGTATVAVSAQSGGSNYNLPATSYTIAGNPSYTTASGSAMTGGTDNIVQVISQADIDGAKAKISTTDPSVKQALDSQLSQDGMFPLDATFNAGTPTVTSSANAGDAASNVTVTEQVTYTMLGVKESDLKTVVDNNVKSQIDTSKQSILNQGLSGATFTVNSSNNNVAQMSLQTVAVAGPQLDINAIKSQVAGKKPGDVKSLLENDPDVTNVNVKLSPFWVTSVPKNLKKITITIAKPKVTKNSSANAQP